MFGSAFGGASKDSSAGANLFGATSSLFGAPASSPSIFGAPASSPSIFGAPASSPSIFGAPASSPSLFGVPSSTPGFGASSSSGGLFGNFSAGASSPSIFGAPSTTPGATPTTTSSFWGGAATATPSSFTSQPSIFGTGQSQPSIFSQQKPSLTLPGFGQSQSSPAFGGLPQTQPSLFGTPNSTAAGAFGYGAPSMGGFQLQTQMAPLAPSQGLPPPADREVQGIIDAYNEEPQNPKYAFRHLFLSVTHPANRGPPPGSISDLMWTDAMSKLEAMDTSEREMLWPELAQGFTALSQRLRLQDEAILADSNRLRATEANVRALARHMEAETKPWVERLRNQEKALRRRLLHAMRIVEALEKRGLQIPLSDGERQLAARLRSIIRQLAGQGGVFPVRVESLTAAARQLGTGGAGNALSPALTPGSMEELFGVLHRQTEAVTKLAEVIKIDSRDLEIMLVDLRGHGGAANGTPGSVAAGGSPIGLKSWGGSRGPGLSPTLGMY